MTERWLAHFSYEKIKNSDLPAHDGARGKRQQKDPEVLSCLFNSFKFFHQLKMAAIFSGWTILDKIHERKYYAVKKAAIGYRINSTKLPEILILHLSPFIIQECWHLPGD